MKIENPKEEGPLERAKSLPREVLSRAVDDPAREKGIHACNMIRKGKIDFTRSAMHAENSQRRRVRKSVSQPTKSCLTSPRACQIALEGGLVMPSAENEPNQSGRKDHTLLL